MTTAPQVSGHDLIDRAEQVMKDGPLISLQTQHALALGYYIRQCVIPADTLASTKIHGGQHPFHILCGRGTIRDAAGNCTDYSGPVSGVTEPGTRRIIYAETETIWTTFHPIEELGLKSLTDEIEQAIMIPHSNPGVPYLNSQNQRQIATLPEGQ